MGCKARTEVYSRVVGYYRPVQQWNRGKQEEYFDRKNYNLTDPGNTTAQLANKSETKLHQADTAA